MKKILSAILTVTTLLGCFVFSVSAEGETPSITENLVVAYDFEGNTKDYQLSDKAPAGNVNDDLTIANEVTIKDGVATVGSDQTSRLYAANTADLKGMSGYTVYVKVKASGTYNGSVSDFINMPGLFRGFINAAGYKIGGTHATNWSYGYTAPKLYTFTDGDDDWFYVAYTAHVDTENQKLVLYTYCSNDGSQYTSSEIKEIAFTDGTVGISDVASATINLAFSTQGITYSLDDVMIFNKALSDTEVQQISSIKLDIKKDYKKNLVVAYDFEGKTEVAQLSDKAPAGSVDNTLTKAGTASKFTIANGIATVTSGDNRSYLKCSPGADLSGLTEYTVYMRVKHSGQAIQNASYINAGGMCRWKIASDANNITKSSFDVNYRPKPTTGSYVNNTGGIEINTTAWMNVAMSVKLDKVNGTAAIEVYCSADNGLTYTKTFTKEWTGLEVSDLTSGDISFGLSNGTSTSSEFEMSYDDIMIFNKALSLGEVAEITSFKLADYKDSMVVAYDFEGADATKQLKDKAPKGSANDLTENGEGLSVTNGVTFCSEAESRYKLTAGDDLSNLSEYTIYTKAKYTGSYGEKWAYFFKGGNVGNLFVTTDNAVELRMNSNAGQAKQITGLEANTWLYFAVAVTLNGTNMKVTWYYSTDGVAYDQLTASYSVSATEMTFGNDKGTIELGRCDDGKVTVSYDDVMIFNRALSYGEVTELSTVKLSQDRLGYVGHQTRNVTATSYDIRFVSVIDSTDYDSVGYDIVVWNNGRKEAELNYPCNTVYDKIVELDFDRTSAELGGKYIFAVGLKGFDVIDGTVKFEVTPYYYQNGQKKDLTTVEVVYVNGVRTSSTYVYD